MIVKSAAVLAFAVFAPAVIVPAAFACCGVGLAPVRFTGQNDIVIWDAARKVEHFVREARFDSGSDLGFLAPVPSVPTFAEASPEAFDLLERVVTPPSATRRMDAGAMSLSTAASAVVLKRENVAGYDAVVLKAGDAAALRGWLSKNGFPAPEWMEAWAAPYLKKGWPIAAFKVRKGEVPRPVRMTFSTEKPFAPYAVPKENGGYGAPLRLYLVSAEQLGGRIRERNWGARQIGEGTLADEQRTELARALHLKPEEIPAGATVAGFEDSAFGTEPTHDLMFEPTTQAGFGGALMTGGAIALVAVALSRLFPKRR